MKKDSVIPTQFPQPSLVTLVEPIGDLSLADMMWTFIDASTAYGFTMYLIAVFANLSDGYWQALGGGRPRSPLYGIWHVERLLIDGQLRPASMNAYDYRWRRVIFDTPDVVVVQRTDDSFSHYGAVTDADGRRFMLRKGSSTSWKGEFVVERPEPERLRLSGDMEGYRVEAELQMVPFDTFKLLNSTFRWIRPPDQTP